jgi:hypothetical protein
MWWMWECLVKLSSTQSDTLYTLVVVKFHHGGLLFCCAVWWGTQKGFGAEPSEEYRCPDPPRADDAIVHIMW